MSEEKDIIAIMDDVSLADKIQHRKAIVALEQAMMQEKQVEIPPVELVHGGVYARAVTVPEGTLLTGQIYKFDHIEVMCSGTLVVTTDDGASKVLKGFNLMPAISGKKRAAYAIEETTWITFHSVGDTGDMTGQEIQDSIACNTFAELQDFYNSVNKIDYENFLLEIGLTQSQMDEIVQNEDDLWEVELKDFGLELRDSEIHGTGMFARQNFHTGDIIGLARVDEKRTQLGRYINHAVRPNCRFEIKKDHVLCVANTDIAIDEELTVNYRNTMRMRSEEGDI